MDALAMLDFVRAAPCVPVVVIRSGIELPDGRRPVPGETLELPGDIAAAYLRGGAIDLAPSACVEREF